MSERLDSSSSRQENIESPLPYTKEFFNTQLGVAFKVYRDMHWSLSNKPLRGGTIGFENCDDYQAHFESWLSQDKLDYMNEQRDNYPDIDYTLLARPNLISQPSISHYFQTFSAHFANQAGNLDKKLIEFYSSQQLSGSDQSSNGTLSFQLMPNSYTPDLFDKPQGQIAKLATLQAEHPFLKVPSLLDVIAYWENLKAQGRQLESDVDIRHLTYVRHFDLPPVEVDGLPRIPVSFISIGGNPYIIGSDSHCASFGRLAIS